MPGNTTITYTLTSGCSATAVVTVNLGSVTRYRYAKCMRGINIPIAGWRRRFVEHYGFQVSATITSVGADASLAGGNRQQLQLLIRLGQDAQQLLPLL